MNANQLATAITELKNVTENDLNTIVRAINYRRALLSRVVKNQFRANDQVEFVTRQGITIRGVVVKVMQKNVRVLQTEGRTCQWTVAPSFLRKVAA